METAVNKSIRARTYDFVTKRVVYHSLFWLALFILLISLNSSNQNLLSTSSIELVNILFYGVVVYFNLFYLIPNYLSKKKFLLYCGLLFLSVIIVTPIKIFIFYFWFSYFPELRVKLLQLQNWYFLSTFLIAGSSTILKIISDWVRYQRDRQSLQTQTMQSELKFLKSQINPHFLFNTLNSLYALTLKQSEKAPEIVIKLSEMMRYMLYECNERRVLLSKEVNYIRNYLDLEGLRQGKNVDIHFEVMGEVKNQKIAPLMFIPFLENSFKHGLSHHLSKGFVMIRLHVERQQVRMIIENSKAESLPTQHHRPSGGIGLVNVRRRLNLIYPDAHQLNIKDNPQTYSVDLTIQLDQ